MQQATNQRALAVVDGAGGDETQHPAVLGRSADPAALDLSKQ